MIIRFLARCGKANINQAELKLFKPFNLPIRLYVNNHEFFEIEISGGEQSFEAFCYDLGYVVSSDYFNDEALIMQLYQFIQGAKIEMAPAVNCFDQSNAAKLAREILREYPHCTAQEFKRLALIESIDHGYSKADLKQAINNYS